MRQGRIECVRDISYTRGKWRGMDALFVDINVAPPCMGPEQILFEFGTSGAFCLPSY